MRIVVERSGGFAGLTRRWEVAPPADDATWQGLVASCPWEQPTGEPSHDDARHEDPPQEQPRPHGVDRFAWTLTAVAPDRRCHAALSEQEATGPWRALIDAVRGAAGGLPSASAPEE